MYILRIMPLVEYIAKDAPVLELSIVKAVGSKKDKY
jgi:hypothetical protein